MSQKDVLWKSNETSWVTLRNAIDEALYNGSTIENLALSGGLFDIQSGNVAITVGIELIHPEPHEGTGSTEPKGTIALWSEGYAATGQHMAASFHGVFRADSLKDAVQQFKDAMPEGHSKDCIQVDTLTFWGCRFYDNEKAARSSFG